MSKFYQSNDKNNILLNIYTQDEKKEVSGVTPIEPNTTDAAQEKHVPVIAVNGRTVEVCVGSVPHPMLEEHYITGIYIETSAGGHFAKLAPGAEPKAVFELKEGEKLVAAYEYCNLHGLWKLEA